MSGNTDSTPTTDAPPSRALNFAAFKEHAINHKVDMTLWVLRIATIIFTLCYLLPIFGNAQSCYFKAILANAATSALRLHQRVGTVQLSMQFLAQLMLEDSCHYLLYSLIFLYAAPVTLVLIPVALFAILHSASYSLTLLDTLGQNAWWGARLLISIVEFQSRNILRLISFTEIILIPMCLVFVLMGKAGLMTPFVYYHFIIQRYTSRRNPYTRNMFHELRVLIETTATKPAVPAILKKLLLALVHFTCKLAPPQAAAAAAASN